MASDAPSSEIVWPLRIWVLAVLGGLFALAMQQLSDLPDSGWIWGPRIVAAAILFLGTSGIAFGLAWQRGRLVPALVIALVCGIVAGNVLLWNGAPNSILSGPDGWHLFCGLVASAFLLTLFQAGQDRAARWPVRWTGEGLRTWKREAIHYADVHDHLWTNALLGGLSLLFAGLSFGVAHLMAEMFWLVKLGFLRDLLREEWFCMLLLGAAFGAALGLLLDRGAIISALQRVAMIVLRVLAPVVATGIFVFLAALPFTGLAPLWDTGGTTPIMLGGAMLALFLANAVVSDTPEDESRSIVLRSSAAALGLFLLPMVGIAVFSSGLRIGQHGLSPDRVWALAFLVVASITAIAYAVAILPRRGWLARLRRTNLQLVFLLTGIAFLLSTPLFSFERIAVAQQIARLSGGQVSSEAFDYRALWFEFGPPGRAAIERLASGSPDATVRRYATQVKALKNSWDDAPNKSANQIGAALDRRLTILPRPVPLDEDFRKRLVRFDACGDVAERPCTLRYIAGQDYAIVISSPAPRCDRCTESVSLLLKQDGTWSDRLFYLAEGDRSVPAAAAVRSGRIEMRPVERRQIFIDGKPVGEVILPENAAAP
jgi:uncharacterized membrane protein YiaA